MQPNYLEDWLLFMGGIIKADCTEMPDPWRRQRPIKLATYDTRFIDSVVTSIRNKNGLTDRQLLLAIKIILKYKRQWTQLGLDPSYLESDDVPLRLPQRMVDRTHAAWIEDKKIFIKFPYDPKIISKMNEQSDAPGAWQWHVDKKYWSMDLLECNVAALVEMKLFESNAWQIDARLQELLDLCRACLQDSNVMPRLEYENGQLALKNCNILAQESMIEQGYIQHGTIRRALIAAKHGMTIDKSVIETLDADDPRRELLWAQFPSQDEYPGRSSMTWNQLIEIMKMEYDLNYVFLYRANNMPKVMEKTKHVDVCNKEYITVAKGHSFADAKSPKQSILITDILIGNPAAVELVQQHLAVLYMIADDERVNA